MKAVGYRKSLPVEDADSLTDVAIARPEPKGRDIRVAVKAVSVNPVDYKVRQRAAPPDGETEILGYDAAGSSTRSGRRSRCSRPGDEVYYAGSSSARAPMPSSIWSTSASSATSRKSLSFTQAAAMPLTAITAWELLFDRLGAVPGKSASRARC